MCVHEQTLRIKIPFSVPRALYAIYTRIYYQNLNLILSHKKCNRLAKTHTAIADRLLVSYSMNLLTVGATCMKMLLGAHISALNNNSMLTYQHEISPLLPVVVESN